MVHNGAQESCSFSVLQTGRAFAITSMPVSNRVKYKGTVDMCMLLEDCAAVQ